MEELIAEQCAMIVKLQEEIEEARNVAEFEGCEMDGASLADLVRQMAHKISEVEREARSMEQQSDEWEDAHNKLQDRYDALESEQEQEADEERQAIEDATENLLVALGHARRPMVTTGIPELDALVAAVGL